MMDQIEKMFRIVWGQKRLIKIGFELIQLLFSKPSLVWPLIAQCLKTLKKQNHNLFLRLFTQMDNKWLMNSQSVNSFRLLYCNNVTDAGFNDDENTILHSFNTFQTLCVLVFLFILLFWKTHTYKRQMV